MSEIQANDVAVYPTMVVGLGGTGCKIAKRLKRTLHAEGAATLNIKFVGVDTDLAERTARSEAEMPLDRFISIGGQPIHFDPHDRVNAPMLHWLPTDDAGNLLVSETNLGAGQGAGGHRLVGRFAYNYFAPDQFINLQQTIDQLLDLGNNPLVTQWEGVRFKYLPGLAVYVIGSLAGGTGSGVFIDVLATLHRLTERALADRKRFFTGIFLLPSVFDYRAIGSQSYDHCATAYACLHDLDILLSRDDPELHTFWYYNDPKPYVLSQRLLDSCYLVDRYSGSGALMRDEDVYDFVATHLYAAIGTPLGAASRSVENNSHKTGIEDEHGGRCAYSAFGLVGMDYSQELLGRYCAARLGIDTIDLVFGSEMTAAEAEADSAAFLRQVGLAGGRNSRVATTIQGDVGRAYIKRPEEMEDQRTVELHDGLAQGLQEFNRGLESGNLRAELQKNYRDNLLATPDAGRGVELLPGQVAPVEPQMWRHRLLAHVEETVRRVGLRAGKRLAEAFREELERSFQEFETGLADVRNNVQTAQSTFNGALEAVRNLTPTVQIFRRQAAREVKRNAALARNALVQSRLRLEAAELARRVYNDDTDGVLHLVAGLITQMDQLLETLDTARETLKQRAKGIESDSREGADTLGAPDRSCLLYDVLPGRAFPQIYASMSDRKLQLLERLTGGHSALRLLEPIREENKAEALTARICRDAADQFPELADRHILDVVVGDARDQTERLERLKMYLRDVSPRLRPHAPTRSRRGESQTYDYCVVMYPRHPDGALNDAFQRAAEEIVREAQATVQVVPSSGAKNRILMTYMQHGIPLNFKSFPQLERWLEAYEHLRKRNPYLDVDRRWRKLPGPGQQAVGGAREKLFTLGVAYGLIARQGDFFYTNFQRALLRHDKEAANERDQYEVDLAKVQGAIEASRSPVDWFQHVAHGPSSAPTIPAQFGPGLGTKEDRDERDRIGQGRENAMRAFAENQGEDYADVANAIAAIMLAYTEEQGRAQIREELTWYRGVLDEERCRSTALEPQYQREIDRVDELLETLSEEGHFDLPVGHV
jgi:hypothetical protein